MFSTRMLMAILFLLVSCSRINSNTSVEGIYQSVSESEWAVTVSLLSGGNAEIKLENWKAGEYDKRDSKLVNGRWSINDNKILLKYEGITDILNYTDNLSLIELGFEGSAPGLMQVSPIERTSIVHGVKLWKKPHRFSKKQN